MDPEGDAPEPLSSRTLLESSRPRLFRRAALREAIKAFQRISRADHSHLAFLAACHAQLGDTAAATGAAREVLQRAPDFSIERFIATQHYKHEKDREHHRAALVKAQLPA